MALVQVTNDGDRTGLVRSPQKIILKDDAVGSTLFGARCELNLTIWQGDITSDKPASPQFTLYTTSAPTTIPSTEAEPHWYFEISEYIRQYCSYPDNVEAANGIWLEWDANVGALATGLLPIEYHTIGWFSDIQPVEDLIEDLTTFGALNALDGRYAAVMPQLNYFSSNTSIYLPYTTYGSDTNDISFTSLTSNNTYNTAIAGNDDSTDQMRFYEVNDANLLALGFTQSEIDNERFRATISSSTVSAKAQETVFFEKKCFRAPITQVTFINRYGNAQTLSFRGRFDTMLNKSGEDYLGQIANVIGQYSTTAHQRKEYDVRGKEKFTINTGQVFDDEKGALIDLMMSERVWVKRDDQQIPVIITSSDFQYYNSNFDKLKDYTFEFMVAKNLIQDIR